MKTKCTALSLALGSALCAMSQPVLTSADICPRAGDIYLYNSTEFAMENTEGADLLWDFTALEMTDWFSEISVTAPLAGEDSDMPAEVLFLYAEDYGTWGIRCTEDSLTALYSTRDHPKFQSPVYQYSDPLKFLEFPLTYADAFADQSYTQDNYNIDVTTDLRTRVTGYGTLKLPGMTIENVLQVKTTGEVSNLWTKSDGSGYSQKETIPHTVYSYWAVGHPFPLLQVDDSMNRTTADFMVAALPDHAEREQSGIMYGDSLFPGTREDIHTAALYDINMNKRAEWTSQDFVRNSYGHLSMKFTAAEPGFYIFIAKTKDKTYYSIENYRSL